MLLEPVNLDQRLPADHRARVVWAVVQKLDLGRFEAPLVNRGSTPGRSAIDPALLVALWLYATIDNVGSRAIVAVDVVNTGGDAGQSEPPRRQAERRSGRRVKEHLFDGGFVNKELIGAAESGGVAIYAPLPKNRAGEPCTHERKDSPGVAAWRRRMSTPAALLVYQQRAATAETVNAETRRYRGLGRFLVRGLRKVRCVALWSALAYNVVHFGEVLMRT
jgi:hypothetical protein